MTTLQAGLRQGRGHPSRKPRPPVNDSAVPPLEAGDRLTRSEFERRYQAMPGVKKAELIEGVVHMPSPVRARHSRAHGLIMAWLAAYVVRTAGVELHDNATVRLDADNVVQPDALLRLVENGRSLIGDDDYLEGAPELIVEVAASSASYDLYDKLNVYRRNGVPEYVVWQLHEQRLDWFYLEEEQYVPLEADTSGTLHSRVFPGLRLPVKALLEENMPAVLAAAGE
jgi:Uma2 family endonuclease